jgi:ATP/maltotriose-dependent transcriptional regulator MalT
VDAATLSLRETQVLERIALGYSNKDIGGDLRIAPSTVAQHVNSIFGKLRVKSRLQAALWWVRDQPAA